MQEAIEKASTLIEALEWIRKFRDKIIVIKLGGSVMGDETALRHVLIDIVFMETVGMRPVLVHGGGDLISQAMREAGIEPQFVQGRRYTDEATLKIVEEVLAYQTNERLAAEIEKLGGRAMNLNFRTTNVLTGEKIQLEGDEGPIDLGQVGQVTRVDRQVIENLCYAGTVPVIPSMCLDQEGQILNVNADTAAMAVAQSLGAEKLVFLSDINGVRSDKDDPDSLLYTLTADRARELIDSGVIDTGMIPKVQACLETLEQGVGKVHIIDGRIRHSLLLEVYTTEGIGTQLIQESESKANEP
ncbi:MAG TPA: acetylglutamate kinase [Planctomycetes bacterium]|nr:acetylglutamate kinase [Planctomycetota bacterium]